MFCPIEKSGFAGKEEGGAGMSFSQEIVDDLLIKFKDRLSREYLVAMYKDLPSDWLRAVLNL